MSNDGVEFGLGLISIGRNWGFRPRPLPRRDEAHRFLLAAVETGVTSLDTAPSYGSSEAITGEVLRNLPASARELLTVATKCGERWDEAAGAGVSDHSFDGLARSIDRSLAQLGRIDVLQIHKTTTEVLRSADLKKALAYARSRGIPVLGASVKDLESGRMALAMDEISMIQMPYNLRNTGLRELFDAASSCGKHIWTNRPFAMGELLHRDPVPARDVYRFVLQQRFRGAVLTGTASVEHLRDNLRAFEEARQSLSAGLPRP